MKRVTKIKNDKNLESIGKRIEFARRNKEISQEQLAEKLYIKRELLNMYENDNRIPKVDTIIALSKELGVSADFLLCTSPIKKPSPTLQTINEYTGLSEKAIEALHFYKQYETNKMYDVDSETGEPFNMSYVNNLHLLNLLLENEDGYFVLSELAGYIYSDFTSVDDNTAKSFEVFNKSKGIPQNVLYERLRALYLDTFQENIKLLYNEQVKDGDTK